MASSRSSRKISFNRMSSARSPITRPLLHLVPAADLSGLLLVPDDEQGGGHGLVRSLAREYLFGQPVQDGPLDVARVLELVHEEVQDLPVEPVEDVRRFPALEQVVGIDLEVVEVQKPSPELRVLILFLGAKVEAEEAQCLAAGLDAGVEAPEPSEQFVEIKKGFFIFHAIFARSEEHTS